MSGISPGSPVSASNSNASWLAKNGDDTSVGKVSLNNPDSVSGPAVNNIQREINSLDSFSGRTAGSPYNATPAFSNNQVGSIGDNLMTRADALSEKFDSSLGHTHSGGVGDAPPIPSANVSNVPLFARTVRAIDIPTVNSGSSSVVVTSLMTGNTPSTSPTVKGWPVNNPYNKVILRDSSGTEITHVTGGEAVYGRLTYASGVWTITFFYLNAGVETAYTFNVTHTNVQWYSQVLINPITDTGYTYDSGLYTPSANATNDVVDATPTQRGLVNTGTQSFAGEKTFQDGLDVWSKFLLKESVDTTTTGALASVTPSQVLTVFKNASLTSIAQIAAPAEGMTLVWINNTGAAVLIKNETGGVAANRIRTGTLADISMENGSSLILTYDSDSSRWQIVGGSGAGGAKKDLSNLTATAINASLKPDTNAAYYCGDNGFAWIGVYAQVMRASDANGYVDLLTNTIKDSTNKTAVDFENRKLKDATEVDSVDFNARVLKDSAGGAGFDFSSATQNDNKSKKLVNVADPVSLQDAATKNFVLQNGGLKNYLPLGNAEATNPFTMYANGTAVPTTGTGGSPTATISISSSSPLAGANSFLFTSGALGNGGAYAFSIDAQDKTTEQTLTLSTSVAGGTYNNGDLTVWLYDVTNSVLISPQPSQQVSNYTGKQNFIFQLGSGTSYRFLIHQATSASFVMKFEASLTAMPFAGYGSITSTAIITEEYSSGTSNGNAVVGFNTRNINTLSDPDKIIQNASSFTGTGGTNTQFQLGPGKYNISAAASFYLVNYYAQLFLYNVTDSAYVANGLSQYDTNGEHLISLDASFEITSNKTYEIRYYSNNNYTNGLGIAASSGRNECYLTAKIQRITQSPVISSYDGRVVAAHAYVSANYSTSAGDYVNFDTVTFDSHSCITTGIGTTWKYKAKVAGKYRVSSVLNLSSGSINFKVYKNGSPYRYLLQANTGIQSGEVLVDLLVDDEIALQSVGGAALAGGTPPICYINIDMLSGAQQILAGQRIFTSVYLTANQAMTANTTTVKFTGTFEDTVGAWDNVNGRYNCKATGDYLISCGLGVFNTTSASTYITHYNSAGTPIKGIYISQQVNNVQSGIQGTSIMMLHMNIGDYFTIMTDGNTTFTGGQVGSNWTSHLEVKQVN